MRDIYMGQLNELNYEMSGMGQMVKNSIEGAVTSLLHGDKEKARQIIKQDVLIDSREKEIESACLHMLLQQTPVASDLRQVSGALKMVTDLERIGDHAADISEIVLVLEGNGSENVMDYLERMAEATSEMVTECMAAYITQDLKRAREIAAMDDKVDRLFDKTKRIIAEEVCKDMETGMRALDLLMIAKYFERIGDHAENIGEWVVFSITGEHKNERVI